LAGELRPEIKSEYFRIGHMGATKPGEPLATIGAIEAELPKCGYKFDVGAGASTV